MAFVAYERAWARLAKYVASKSQHGREGLLMEMACIAEDCELTADELATLSAIEGVEVVTRREQDRPAGAGSDGDLVAAGSAAAPDIIDRTGGHDGSRNGIDRRAGP